jgi:hypothetical protein
VFGHVDGDARVEVPLLLDLRLLLDRLVLQRRLAELFAKPADNRVAVTEEADVEVLVRDWVAVDEDLRDRVREM